MQMLIAAMLAALGHAARDGEPSGTTEAVVGPHRLFVSPQSIELQFMHADGAIQTVVTAEWSDVAASPERVASWAHALVELVRTADGSGLAAHPETFPALLRRPELRSQADFRTAMGDPDYCGRAAEACELEFDVWGAVAAGNDLALRDLLDANPASVCAEQDGVALLHAAAMTTQPPYGPADAAAVLRLLLARGADPNQRQQGGDTPLHVATPSAIPLLVAAGARLDARNDAGLTPLQAAVEEGDEERIAALVAQGA